MPARPLNVGPLFDTGTVQHDLEFIYEGKPVGYFEESECPTVSGRYRYMPYRGIGHYELGLALRDGKHPRCTVPSHPDVSFSVLACPEYGVLELSEFSEPGRVE